MSIRIAAQKASQGAEKRVAIVPYTASKYRALGATVMLEKDAGLASAFPNVSFNDVTWFENRDALKQADILVCVEPPSIEDIAQLKPGCVLVGLLNPYKNTPLINALLAQRVTSFALELMPRISRAQSMDVLSSQASAAGYKAVLMAANHSKRFFPMLTTAAGTIKPSKVLVLGAGVAGLQAIATSKRLGAIVEAYDIRPVTKEQVESLGAKFIALDIDAEGEGGYARELTDDEKQQANALVAQHVAAADVVITTAAIPGRPAPKLISRAMVEAMKPGSIIVDLAAETGGNCELTQAGQTVHHHNTDILGPVNIPSQLATDTSEMLARNIQNFVSMILSEGAIQLDWNDEIIHGCCVTHDGLIKNDAIKNAIGG